MKWRKISCHKTWMNQWNIWRLSAKLKRMNYSEYGDNNNGNITRLMSTNWTESKTKTKAFNTEKKVVLHLSCFFAQMSLQASWRPRFFRHKYTLKLWQNTWTSNVRSFVRAPAHKKKFAQLLYFRFSDFHKFYNLKAAHASFAHS